MKFVVKKLEAAEADSLAAAAWYDEQLTGLGTQFLDEVADGLIKLEEYPELFAIRFANVRCLRLNRFNAYGIYYFIIKNEVRVISIFHAGRHPRWLRKRRHELD